MADILSTMKIILSTLLAFALLTSTASADTFTVSGVPADTYGQPTNGRVFMFHAMNGTRAHDQNQGSVIDGLVADGYQVIAPTEPFDGPNQAHGLRAAFLADNTQGQSYRDQWAAYTHDLIAAADSLYGTAPRLLMAGQSWGGFSAMLAACSNPETDGFLVTIPVVDPTSYQLFADVPLANLQLTAQGCSGRLAAMPGFIAWGDADSIVGTAPTRALVRTLGASVTSCEYAPLDHGDSPLAYAGMVRWVQGARDCLPWPTSSAPAPATAPAAPAAQPAPAAVAPAPAAQAGAPAPVVKRARCNRSTHCESIVRRHKLYHVYYRHSKHPRWVYVRRASR